MPEICGVGLVEIYGGFCAEIIDGAVRVLHYFAGTLSGLEYRGICEYREYFYGIL